LKIETQPLEEHQVKLIVEVDPQPFEDAKQRAARRLAKQVKIPGFRPGKAPYAVIVRHLGEPAIIEEAVELLVNDIYPEAIKEAKIEPYGMGSLDNIPKLDPPTFEFIVPLKAQVELGDYHSVRFPYALNDVTDIDVENVLRNLQDRQALVEPVQRPAEEGDLVRIRIYGERNNPIEGEETAILKDRPLSVIIESSEANSSDEFPFPGFSRYLLGLSSGEQKSVEHSFPDDTDFESLRGASVIYTVSVEQVNSRSVPELDDEFAKTVGDYETLDGLRQEIRKDLEKQAEDTYNDDYDDQVLEEVIKLSTIKFPPQMLGQEVGTVINRLESNLAQQNLDLDLYLKTRQLDMDGLREEVKPVAVTRLQKTLTLLEIAEAEKINVEPDELQSETSRTIDELSYYMQEKDFRKMLQTDESRTNLVSNIMMQLLIDRTQDRLRDIARGLVETGAESAQTESQSAETEEEAEEAPGASQVQPSGEIIELNLEQDTLPEENPEEVKE
jgi:trigger factor